MFPPASLSPPLPFAVNYNMKTNKTLAFFKTYDSIIKSCSFTIPIT